MMNPECGQEVGGSIISPIGCPERSAAPRIGESNPFEQWLTPSWLARAGASNHTSVLSLHDTSVLLIHDEGSCLATLGRIFRDHLLVDFNHVRNCEEASRALSCGLRPHLILTDTKLPDGSWEEILKLAATNNPPVNVLIVSRIGNIGLYREAIRRGAYDFITPNIPPAAFVQLLKDAKEDICLQRKSVCV
jgi:ActR/RegA family two-component response regulator